MRNPTGYYRPRTVAEAVRLLSQPHITTVLLSGGALRLGTTDDPDYEAVIDLQAIDALGRIAVVEDGTLSLGANATLQTVARHDDTPPLLRQVLTRSLVWNRRNGITIGEAIEYPGEVAELTAALLALGATVVFAMPEEHRVPLPELHGLVEQPRLPQKGLITAVELPPAPAGRVWGEAHVARTPADTAIVSVAAVLVADSQGIVTEARLALAGVWPEPARLGTAAAASLVGAPLDEARIDRAVQTLEGEVAPVADYRGSAEYRRAMAGVLARRALAQCQKRLGQAQAAGIDR